MSDMPDRIEEEATDRQSAGQRCKGVLENGTPCRYRAKPGEDFCAVHGVRITRGRNGQVRSVGVIARALYNLRRERPELFEHFILSGKDSIQSLRRQSIDLQIAILCESLSAPAISRPTLEWLQQLFDRALQEPTKYPITPSEAALILRRCRGPDIQETLLLIKTLLSGIRDAESNPYEMLAYSLLRAIMEAHSIEELRGYVTALFSARALSGVGRREPGGVDRPEDAEVLDIDPIPADDHTTP